MTTTRKTLRTCLNGHKYYKSSDCPACPTCEKELNANRNIFDMVSAPARRALENNGINTLQDLSKYSEGELLSLHGLGKSSIPKLKKALMDNGFALRQP